MLLLVVVEQQQQQRRGLGACGRAAPTGPLDSDGRLVSARNGCRHGERRQVRLGLEGAAPCGGHAAGGQQVGVRWGWGLLRRLELQASGTTAGQGWQSAGPDSAVLADARARGSGCGLRPCRWPYALRTYGRGLPASRDDGCLSVLASWWQRGEVGQSLPGNSNACGFTTPLYCFCRTCQPLHQDQVPSYNVTALVLDWYIYCFGQFLRGPARMVHVSLWYCGSRGPGCKGSRRGTVLFLLHVCP